MEKIVSFTKRNEGVYMNESKEKENLIQFTKQVLYFSNNSRRNLYKTKLQKLLFYTQFLYYKTYSERLLTDDFTCDHHGPTIDKVDRYLEILDESGVIELRQVYFGTIILPKMVMSKESYTIKEREILHKVINKFDQFTASAISEYSHHETLWKNTKLKGIIAIERARELYDF